MGAQGTEKHLHSREVGFILPQPPMVENGQEREQAVNLFSGSNLPNQEHVSVFWLVLAQQRCQGSGYLLPRQHCSMQLALKIAQFASIAGSCTRPQRVVLACPGHYVEPGKDLFLSSALVSLVRELWRQSPSNCIFHCAWALGRRSA